ncbi:unnamed protein product [Clonostachys rhizophaga]|uniref:t-SNARE coiled-coil homology domain-containing protein n=1 Tax=Clonostachys rhizophaga TaxID=160324 RepID=A0A9N9ZF83_9HYPO|nr:unnamed protein product [Clonostachys rhizophaga]
MSTRDRYNRGGQYNQIPGGDSQGTEYNPYGGGGKLADYNGWRGESILINTPQGSGYEMNSFQDNANPFQDSSEVRADPNAILNECKDIDRGIEQVESNLDQLRVLQQRTLDDADNSASSTANQQLDSLSTETMALYRSLTERVRQVKSKPDAQSPKNKPQVSRVDRRLKAAIQQYQSVESQFRKRTQDQMARQYRIVRPDATEEQIRQVVEDPNGAQVFSQALMQSDRQGRARAALSAVQDRHRALQKIEQQMVELSQLFQDMDTLVVQQEEMVTDIEHKAEDVVESLEHGNKEIGVAVETARATRRKKFWCALICLAILVVIAIIIVIVLAVQGKLGGSKSQKRSLFEEFPDLPVRALPINSRIVGRSLADYDQTLRNRVHLPQLPS